MRQSEGLRGETEESTGRDALVNGLAQGATATGIGAGRTRGGEADKFAHLGKGGPRGGQKISENFL